MSGLLYFNPEGVKAFLLKYFVIVNLVILSSLIIVIYAHQRELDRLDRANRGK